MNNQPSKSIEQTKLNFKNQDLWINKYKPVSINNIIGNSTQIKNFKEWITNLSSNKSQ
jgi:hypothetical protein